MTERIPILAVTPVVECGRYPAKAAVGEPFEVSSTVLREGHDRLGAGVVLTDPSGKDAPRVGMRPSPGVDRFAATVSADRVGDWTFRVESWGNPYATWRHDAEVKVAASVDVELMLTEGSLLLQRAAAALPADASDAEAEILSTAAGTLANQALSAAARLEAGTASEVAAILDRHPLRELLSTSSAYPLLVERERALYGAWYELFPRSEGAYIDSAGVLISGTLETAARRLPAVAAMGFDVVYLPPIHPIGRVNRKGANNRIHAGPDDPGSPWAIGAAEGGHDAVHPELGTLADFDAFVATASDLGLEVALDLALQCAPDHPWVTEHPEWFHHRADGSIAYAENPPKKYQDIYPLDFDRDPEGLRAEVLRVVRHWIAHGVRIFRVDNPHTKPLAFWERLLAEIRATDPDVVLLSEAFTRPPLMLALAAVGFSQSYTYFTWRNERRELEDYLRELSDQTSHVLRPNLFVNTPDILPAFLQSGGPAAFAIRATVAATGAPSWGMYAGFELYEHEPLEPSSEEYLDSEKYQVRVRDWERAAAAGRSLAPYVTALNRLRRDHRALQLLRNLTVHGSDNAAVMCYSKRAGEDVVLVVLTLDPHRPQETVVHLDLPALGICGVPDITVRNELNGDVWYWRERNNVRLDPDQAVAHLLSVRPR